MVEDVTNKKMVAGFLFSVEKVLLVKKERPSWQLGLLNGVGGVVEASETPLQAMEREFGEETAYRDNIDWRHFCTEVEPFGAYVYFFAARMNGAAHGYAWPWNNDVGELLHWVSWHEVVTGRRLAVGNLSWLLPLALDPRQFSPPIVANATKDIREGAIW